jgi:hypothetical protein
MAEKQVDATGGIAANRPSGPEVVIPGSASELIANAPVPADKGGKIYRVSYPTDHFVVNDMPVVDTTGVRLTAEQAKTVLEAAEASGVKIVEVQ